MPEPAAARPGTTSARPRPSGNGSARARPLRLAHDVGVDVELVPYCCLHAPTSSSAFAHGMPAFPRCPRCPRGHAQQCSQTGTDTYPPRRCWLVPAMRGVASGSLAQPPYPQLDERFPAGRGGASAAAPFEFGIELGAEQEAGGPGHWSP